MPPEAQLFFILIVLVIFWFIVMRPARTQQKKVQQLQRDLEVGHDVVLSSGIFGTIRALNEARVELEVAPGTVLQVARQAVVRTVEVEPETDEVLDARPADPESADTPENETRD